MSLSFLRLTLLLACVTGLGRASEPAQAVKARPSETLATAPLSLRTESTIEELGTRIAQSASYSERLRHFKALRKVCGQTQTYLDTFAHTHRQVHEGKLTPAALPLTREQAQSLLDKAIDTLFGAGEKSGDIVVSTAWSSLVPSETIAMKLIRAVKSSSPAVRAAALRVSAHSSYNPKLRGGLARLAVYLLEHDTSQLVQSAAVEALGSLKVGDPRVLEALGSKLGDPDFEESALDALSALDELARPVLPLVRKAIGESLGPSGMTRAVSLLRALDARGEESQRVARGLLNDDELHRDPQFRPTLLAAFLLLRTGRALPERLPDVWQPYARQAYDMDERVGRAIDGRQIREALPLLLSGAEPYRRTRAVDVVWAINEESPQLLAFFLKRYEPSQTEKNSFLIQALQAESYSCLEPLLAAGAEPSLKEAAKAGDPRAVALLMDNGARPTPEALAAAFVEGNVEVVRFLGAKGIDLHAIAIRDIEKAAIAGHTDCLRYLSERGIKLFVTPEGFEQLAYAERADTLRYLVANFPEFSTQEYLAAALKGSAQIGDLASLRFVIGRGVDLEGLQSARFSSLFASVEVRPQIEALLDAEIAKKAPGQGR